MIKAVLFDIDGVLISVRTGDVSTYQKILRAAGYQLPEEEKIDEIVHLPLWEGVKHLIESDDINEINRVRDVLLDPGIQHKSLIKYPDSLFEVLSQLSDNYRLGIVTGRLKKGVDELFSEQNVGHLFEHVITYEDTTSHKPDPEPLLLAIQSMSLAPEQAVYVGDMDYDILAANNADMKSIHLSQKQNANASVWIDHFDKLPGAIESLHNL